ncbi:hypothetical protein [uncultured Roseobacter sp.]|uniref:hypothetical protein n=1 Tax=uncultured Roseobacter sp. TaxID=114847 RepID=UPI0026142D2B|nr:hypothetical protein [uncultured Roseobacter sp.]
MAPSASHEGQAKPIKLGHPWRLMPETRELTLLVLGHLIVFFMSMGHDEIVAELVEDGWLIGQYAERFEIVIGFVLFLCWSALTLRLFTVLQRARASSGLCPACDEAKR